MAKFNSLPPVEQSWVDARRRHRLTHAQVQMARELGMNPKRLARIDDHSDTEWKRPLPEYIQELYQERFGKEQPDSVQSVEERVRLAKAKKSARRKEKTRKQTTPWQNKEKPSSGPGAAPFAQTYLHGTKADLKIGDEIAVGFNSNFGQKKNARYVFLTATLDAAVWGAELAVGDGRERIYLVEPTGPIEDDPDLTDKKFPGNPTKSYRSTHPFRVVGEVASWRGHPADQIQTMKDHLRTLEEQGINSLNE